MGSTVEDKIFCEALSHAFLETKIDYIYRFGLTLGWRFFR